MSKGYVMRADAPSVERQPRSSGPAPCRPSLSDATAKVLLIDAGDDVERRLVQASNAQRAPVHHVKGSEEAERLALQHAYEIIIVDAELAAGPGLAVLERIAMLQRTAAFVISARPGERVLGEVRPGSSLHGSLLGTLRKPWSDDELTCCLERARTFATARAARELDRRAGTLDGYRVSFLGTSAELAALTAAGAGGAPRLSFVRFGSVEEAIVGLGGDGFDVALTTAVLPDACGLDTVIRLRRMSSQLPVVVLTPNDDPAFAAQALAAGAQDVLCSEGLDEATLVRALRHAVQRQRAQALLQHGAAHDELTGLAKRSVLYQRIENALARCRRLGNTFAVMYIDLDCFKSINDTYGHDVGDGVLVTVAQRLTGAVREYDTVARLGGDEFAILLDTLDDPEEAVAVAQRVLGSLARPICVAGHALDVTASMGISVFPHGGGQLDELIRSADQAMYCAKRSGRNTYSLAPRTSELRPADEGRPRGAALRRSTFA